MAVIEMTGSGKSRRFLMWLLLTLAYMIAHFHRVNLNVLADRLMVEFNLSGVSLGNLAAAYSYMYLIVQIPGGVIIDRFGPRRMGFIASLLIGAGSLLFGYSWSVTGMFLGRLLIGLGSAVIFINILKFQSAWYRANEFATMSGLALFIGGIGSLLASFPLAYIITFIKWQKSFQIVGFLAIAISVLCLVLLKDYPVKIKPGGAHLDEREEKFGGRNFPFWQTIVFILGNRLLWAPFAVFFGILGSFHTLTGAWGVTCLMQIYHVSRSQAALIMLPALLGMILGAPVAGYLSDRFQCRKILIVLAAIFFCINWALLIMFGGRPALLLIYVIGFNLGVSASTTSLILTYAKEISPPAMAASSTAFVNTGTFTGTAILQLLFGYILQRGWDGAWQEGMMIYPVGAHFRALACCLAVAGVSAALSFFIVNESNYERKVPIILNR